MTPTTINIIAFSDPHGQLPSIIDPIDLLLIGGDICPTHSQYYGYQINWFQNDFADWINALTFSNPWSRVVMTWGNHDFVGERISIEELKTFTEKTNGRCVILKNKEYDFKYPDGNDIKIIKIFGTPYCKIFFNWAFMINDEALKKKFSDIPENCDILLSHDAPAIPPYGIINEGNWKGTDAGNKPLADAIIEKKPKLALHGHIHSSQHDMTEINGTKIACVAYINEDYVPTYLPLKIKWPLEQ